VFIHESAAFELGHIGQQLSFKNRDPRIDDSEEVTFTTTIACVAENASPRYQSVAKVNRRKLRPTCLKNRMIRGRTR